MQKRKIWISLLICLCFIYPFKVDAANETVKAVHVDENTEFTFSAEDDLDQLPAQKKSGISAFSINTATAETGLFKSQLTSQQLKIYDALDSVGITAANNGASFTIEVGDDQSTDDIWNTYKTIYKYSMYAFQRDHMDQVLWATNKVQIGASMSTKWIEITVSFAVNDHYSEDIGNQVNSKIDEIVTACTATKTYEKVKYYHDWLVANNDYDTPTSELSGDDGSADYYYSHTAVGCLINGKGVCESYTKAFKLFCLRENIPCLIITGSNHAWNYVKMPDDKWYMVDCTWDDPVGGSGIYYDYFLVTNQPNVDGHSEDDGFVYPITNTQAYDVTTHEHAYEESITKTATCVEEGIKTYTCIECGNTKTETIARDPANHTGNFKTIKEVAASCGEEGYTGDTQCADCHVIIEEGEVIPATGNHKYDEGTVTKAATCAEEGEKTYECVDCEATKTEVIAKNPANHNGETKMIKEVAASCGKEGYTGDEVCEDCHVTIEEGEVISATGNHKYDEETVTKTATCAEEGIKTYKCVDCEATKTETIARDPAKHTGNFKTIKEVAASCGKEGYTGDEVCEDCHVTIEEGEVIPATGDHKYDEETVTKTATCAEEGIKTYKCVDCEATKTEVIAKDPATHTYDDGTETKVATCTEEGIKTYKCVDCGATKTEVIAKNPANHASATKTIDREEASCGKEGYTEEEWCEGCQLIIKQSEVIPATGDHRYDEGTVTEVATCAEEGIKTFTCLECGNTKTAATAKDPTKHIGETTTINQKEATCSEEGYTGDTQCFDCQTIINTGSTIPATDNHTFDEGVITKAATETSTGIKTYTCLECGTSKTEVIPKLLVVLKKLSPSLTNVASGITIKWSKDAKASGYNIYRKIGSGAYKKIKTIAGNTTVSYTDGSVKTANGVVYTYAVRSYKGSQMGAFAGKTIARLTATNITSLKNSSTSTMKLVWKKNTKASGYEITYSTSSTFAKGNKKVLAKKGSITSTTIKKLTKGKKYYVRIRAYKKIGTVTYYSAYSTKKSIKITK